ncbi:MAG: hypothetical protein OXG82_11470 [Gammaproteobacteria bacterium]|nr:hypothetical protein [Gammaproteobacteria bacterium]
MSSGSAPAGRARRPRRSKGSTRFQAERRALGKIQVHFEFQQALMHKIRIAAAAENLSYADYVRKLVGLPYAKIQRPRISLSFGAEDLERLAGRYDRPGADPQALKRCVMDEISSQLDAADSPDDP